MLTLGGAGPGEERAAPFHAALRDVAFATCGCRRDAVSPSPAATEHMAVFWLTGLVSSAVFVLVFGFFFLVVVLFSFLFCFPEQSVPHLAASETTAKSPEKLSSGFKKDQKKGRRNKKKCYLPAVQTPCAAACAVNSETVSQRQAFPRHFKKIHISM